jgi:hypothetical protein
VKEELKAKITHIIRENRCDDVNYIDYVSSSEIAEKIAAVVDAEIVKVLETTTKIGEYLDAFSLEIRRKS